MASKKWKYGLLQGVSNKPLQPDALQRTLRSRFRARLSGGVRLLEAW
jgi:hypothetical protein